ncbi:MAG: GDSL-type esterase/lipase family protein [Pseudomonadota bacterium]
MRHLGRGLHYGAWVAAAWGCSSLWLGDKEKTPETPASAGAPSVACVAGPGPEPEEGESAALASGEEVASRDGNAAALIEAERVALARKGLGDSNTAEKPFVEPVLTDEIVGLRVAAQKRVAGNQQLPSEQGFTYLKPGEDACPPGSMPAVLGRFVPVANEASLRHFHRALARLVAGGDEDGKVRILAYGASHTQADVYAGYLRAYLQSRFGDGGQGFLLLGRVNKWHRTRQFTLRTHGLSVHHSQGQIVENEPLGLFGAAVLGRSANAYAELSTSKESTNTHFELHYFEDVGGGDFVVDLDGKTLTRISTRAPSPRPAYYTFETSPGEHTIRVKLKGNGPVRLFGLVAETAGPGVVVDTLGISGSKAAANLLWNEAAWADAVRRRNPDLVTLAYGTNEAMDSSFTADSYETQLRAVLKRWRKIVPDVSCVLIAPFDVPERGRQRLIQLVDAQRRISKEFNCGFWDGFAFMGGPGSMRRWVAAKPPLANADHVHLTRLGYIYAGVAIGDALLRAYDEERTQGLRSVVAAPPGSSPIAF